MSNQAGTVDEADLAKGDEEIDSAIGSDGSSFTTSIESTSALYRYEHGRRYHSYSDNEYSLPNDEREMNRLEIQHLIWKELLDHQLHLAPLSNTITEALDVGCGTGNWPLEFADQYPDANVTGTDLSPIQPTIVPPNLRFLVDDATQPWSFGLQFDYIHTRAITMGIRDWDTFVQQAVDHLKPGGWLELQEMHFPLRSDDGSLAPETALYKWSEEMIRGMSRIGLDAGSCRAHAQRMQQKGLADVQSRKFKALLGLWGQDLKEKRVGALGLKDLLDGIEGISTKVLLMLGYEKRELEAFLERCKEEMLEGKVHAYMPILVTWGQKPT